jgi:hypothetical protein
VSAVGSVASNMATAFNAKAYVGWTGQVYSYDAMSGAEKFFSALATTNVQGAVDAAQPYPGNDMMPQLKVIGDGTVRLNPPNPHN